MLERLTGSDFSAYLNGTFRIQLAGLAPVVLHLISVTDLGAPARQGARRPFSLIFIGPVSQQYLVQRMYPLEHEHMGTFDLFIVPIGPQDGRMRYEAILT